MSPKTYEMEAYERAQELYIAGKGLEGILTVMRSEGFGGPSKPTLVNWIREGGWKEVKTRALAAKARAAGDEVLALLLESLDNLQGKLRGEEADTKTVFAIVKVAQTIDKLTRGQEPDRKALALEMVGKLTRFFAGKEENEALKALDAHYDEMIEALAG